MRIYVIRKHYADGTDALVMWDTNLICAQESVDRFNALAEPDEYYYIEGE